MGQLDLFADQNAAAVTPLAIVAVCHRCGANTDRIPVVGSPGAPWVAAALWGVVALAAHNEQAHPQAVAT